VKAGTVRVARERAGGFLDKAEEFLRSAQRALAEGDRNAAALLAIHAGISACDSLTVFHLGVRSNSRSHLDVLGVLRGLTFEDREQVERQLRELIAEKREVEYEDRRLMAGDAEKMVRLAERILRTAQRAEGKR
jgi:HEPN domain-containing protein